MGGGERERWRLAGAEWARGAEGGEGLDDSPAAGWVQDMNMRASANS